MALASEKPARIRISKPLWECLSFTLRASRVDKKYNWDVKFYFVPIGYFRTSNCDINIFV